MKQNLTPVKIAALIAAAAALLLLAYTGSRFASRMTRSGPAPALSAPGRLRRILRTTPSRWTA
jgi:hypothetical protein